MRRQTRLTCLGILSMIAVPLAGGGAVHAQNAPEESPTRRTVQQSVPGDTYMDEAARILVRDVRTRRQTFDRSIDDYRTVSTERLSVGHRIIGRDRLLWRRETASRIHWTRTGVIEIDVIGAREVVPVAVSKAQVPADLSEFMPHIAFDPMDAEFLIRFDTTAIIHPFGAAGERNYRFRSGDSSSVRLPDGRTIRIRELEFIPRRRDPHLIAGSFWIDMDSHALVQGVFRLARKFEFGRDSDEDDKPPGWFPQMSMDLTYLAVNYGLYEMRWWLPHYVVAEGVVHLGPLGTLPLKYERTYADYQVIGDPAAPRITLDTVAIRSCHPRTNINISVSTGTDDPDSTEINRRAERERVREQERAERAAKRDTLKNPCVKREYRVTQAPDSVLLNSEHLPGSIYAGETLLSQSEIDAMASRINDLPNVPWLLARPQLSLGLGGPGLLRYNRVEGLSVGARGQVDLGRALAMGEVRYGLADEKVSAELALQRDAAKRSYRLGGYHRLVATDPALRPFSLPSSLGSVLLGIDDAKFFRTSGAELIVAPAPARSQWYNLRVYHERQSDAGVNTDFSLRHLIRKSYEFAPNFDANPATQSGGEVTLRGDFGLNPDRIRGGLAIGARGETGTFEFVRPMATLHLSTPLPFNLVGGVEGSAGTSTGVVPTQSHWYLGGTNTLRGYPIGIMSGDAFWRGRAEVATSLPIARLSLFSDFGWAGSRDDFSQSRPLVSAGAGFSFMDGTVRLDVAHALRQSKDWRLYLYMGGIL